MSSNPVTGNSGAKPTSPTSHPPTPVAASHPKPPATSSHPPVVAGNPDPNSPAVRPIFEGHYFGTMDLQFDRPRKINLEVTLTRTGETVTVKVGENKYEQRQVIDGAFLVDDEGGPFAFTKVSYNLDKNLLDLRYDRQQLSSISFPADFRLVGNFTEKGLISGRVLSGNRGPIGTFQLEPIKRLGLQPTRKYMGSWSGRARATAGGTYPMWIVIGSGLKEVSNPFDLEFDFSPGKLAQYVFNGEQFNFNNVVIDFLRQRVFLSFIDGQGRQEVMARADLDFEKRTMRGTLYGMYRGKSAEFSLHQVK